MGNPTNPLGFSGLLSLGLRSALRDAVVSAVLTVMVALISFGLSAAPRYVNAASDRALLSAVEGASSLQRNVSFSRAGRIAGTAADAFGRVEEQGRGLANTLEGELGNSIDGSVFSVQSPQFEFHHVPPRDERAVGRYFWFRFQEGAEDSIRLVSGLLPTRPKTTSIPIYLCEGGPALFEPTENCAQRNVAIFQTAITQETADWLSIGVGDRVLLDPVIDTPLNLGLPLAQLHYRLALEISGIVALSDPGDDVWLGDAGLHRPLVIPGGFEGYDVYATGLLAAEDYTRLLVETTPSRFSYNWRFFVDYDKLNAGNIETVAAEVNALSLRYLAGGDIEGPRLFTDIEGIAADYRKDRDLTVAYVSLTVIALSGLAISVVVVVAALSARRRENTTILLRARGASAFRLGLARFVEGLVLFVPSSLLGLLAARAFVDGMPASSPTLDAIVVAVILAAIFALMAIPIIAGHLGRLIAGQIPRERRLRRIVVETVIVAVAVGSILLIRRRGLGKIMQGFDPLLAAGPLLVALAGGVLLLRIAPYLARLASAVGSRARGVVGLVGFRSLGRGRLLAQLPALVILIGVTVTVFDVVLLNTVDIVREEGSWQTVGANYRIEPTVEGSRISPQLSLEDVPDVEATADGVLLRAQVTDGFSNRGNIAILAVDLAAYQSVGIDTPADPDLPNSMLAAPSSESVGTESNPIPAILSDQWPLATPRLGQLTNLVIDHLDVVVIVTEIRDEFPGIELNQPFVVLSRTALGLSHDGIDVDPDRRYVRAPDGAADELAASLQRQERGARLISRPSIIDTIRNGPVAETVVKITRIAVWVAVILSAVAVVAGFALTSRQRTRDLGYLRAIGLSRTQMTWVTFTEQLPPAVLATATGVAAGVVLMLLIGPVFDLTPLTGTDIVRPPTFDWSPIGAVVGGLLGTVVLVGAIYSRLNRDMDLASVLRRSDR